MSKKQKQPKKSMVSEKQTICPMIFIPIQITMPKNTNTQAYLGPADITGQLSLVQNSLIVP